MVTGPTPVPQLTRSEKEQLLLRHLPWLQAVIRLHADKRLRSRESCADLLQSACRHVLLDLDTFEFRGEAMFRAWLYRRALMTLVDKGRYHRAQRRDPAREVPLPPDDDQALHASYGGILPPSQHAVLREEIERLEHAFDELPDDYRRVITMAKVADLPHQAIAAELGRTPKAVRNLLGRALARLSGILARNQLPDA